MYSCSDISTILYLAVDSMCEMLLTGRKIRLGDLGDFSANLTSIGTEMADKFSAANITAVNVVWDCGKEFKNLVKDAELNLVASRAAQAPGIVCVLTSNCVCIHFQPIVNLGTNSIRQTGTFGFTVGRICVFLLKAMLNAVFVIL